MSGAAQALITGGCGFIGVNLGRLLVERGWSVTAYDNLSSGSLEDAAAAGYDSVIEGDIRDAGALAAAASGFEYMVHLAAHTNVVESIDDPTTDIELNVGGTLNALLAAREADVAGFVFASSNAPLGEVDPPTHEALVPRPLSPYGASKLSGEALCSAFAGSYGTPATVLRFSNVYGPYSYHKGSVVAAFMKRAMLGEALTIYGDGEQTRDFVYVEDLCRGITQALESGLEGETFHLGSGTETSINDLASRVIGVFSDREVDLKYEPPRRGEIMRNYSDVSKAKAKLGFNPSTTLDDGLAATHAWFREAYSS